MGELGPKKAAYMHLTAKVGTHLIELSESVFVLVGRDLLLQVFAH